MQVYKAIKYIRLSYTDDKTVESDSVANQRRLIDDYIARHPEIEVVAEKIDDGYSGVLFDRPAFQEMMQMIEQGEANCVIVKDLSRLGREYIETGRYMRRVFPAYGVRFIAINDNVDTENDAADDLTVSVKNIMNEAYCRDISVKTRSALEVKRRSGDFVGAFTIYGYVKVGDKHKSLEVDEYAANVVRDIFRKRLEGFSASHIADELNRLGILSPLAYKRNHGMPHAKGGYTDRKDCKWSATTIIRILQDETYTGTLVQGKQTTPHFKLKEREDKPSSEWIRVEGTHEAIIQKHDFDLVQRLRRIDTRTSPKSDKVYLFSGILICGCCGCRMTRKTNRYKDKEYHYYYCPTGKKNGCTSSVMLKESDLIECVQDSLKGHIENVASLDALLSSISQERINRELAQEYAAQIRVNEKRVAQTEGFKAKLYENLVSGILTKEEFLSYKRKYNADIELFQKAIAEWNEKLTDVLENRSERNRWINHFMKFSTMEGIDRRAVMQLIRSIRVMGKDELHIEFNYQDTQLKDESEWFKIPNHHPAIVSVDLFEKANASIKRFSLLNKKPRDYLLRGKVFCGCCDHAMSLRNGAWFYCRHSEVAETLPCHGVRIKMADLEQVVFETIRAQMCPALGIDSNKDKLDLQTVQQAEHEEKLRSIQDSKRHLYEQYALGEIDLETYRTRKAVYDTELVQAKNVHAVITAQTKQIKSDYEIKLKQQEIVQEVGNANILTKALIDRLINKVYVFPGDRIEIEYATQDFLETKESEKEV